MDDRFKFRAFTKNTKELLFVMKLEKDFITVSPSLVVPSCRTLKAEDCILEQCTGLKDKNGKLIYEGDIISLFGGYQEEIVEWCAERLGYFVEVKLTAGADFRPECLGNLRDTIEVIGNIHENPELLEVENDKN